MAIDDTVIAGAVERYSREYDRYLKLCSRVADICRDEVVQANAIRAQVTFRAKRPRSLENKLRKFSAEGKKSMNSIEDVFLQVRDMAAVRVATYVQADEKRVTEALRHRFRDPSLPAGNVTFEIKDKHIADTANFYRATHLEVFLTGDDLIGTYANVASVPCEIQVCSMIAHVWNEIEHDIGYKPTRPLSESERRLLGSLGHLTRTGDGLITELLKATDAEDQARDGAFADVHDFVSRMRKLFPADRFADNAGQLFDELSALGIRKPADLPSGTLSVEEARETLSAFANELLAKSDTRYELDASTADVLFVAVLPALAKRIVDNHPTGRGKGAPTRLSWFAARWLDRQTKA